MKFWVEKLINAICKLDQSGKNVLQKWIKVALYPGPGADRLLKWLEDESQGLDVFDHLLGHKYLEEKYLATCPSYNAGLVAYSQAQRAEHSEAKFRSILVQVDKRLRPDVYDPNYNHQQMLLGLTIPDYKLQTIERFINYVESLMIELDDIPSEEYLFSWMQKNFANWQPVKDSFRLAYRNPIGYPNRCFAFLWHRVNEEVQWAQIEANKKNQEQYLHSLAKLPTGHHAPLWGTSQSSQVAAQKASQKSPQQQKSPATGKGDTNKSTTKAVPPADASKAAQQQIANMKNTISQLEKANKEYKAKLNASPNSKPGDQKPVAAAADYHKLMKLPKPFGDMSAAERKKVLCRFFAKGECTKGKDCAFWPL